MKKRISIRIEQAAPVPDNATALEMQPAPLRCRSLVGCSY